MRVGPRTGITQMALISLNVLIREDCCLASPFHSSYFASSVDSLLRKFDVATRHRCLCESACRNQR